MKLVRIVCGDILENCYILFSKDFREAFVVDPGEEVENIIKLLHEKNTKLIGILLTHGHGDHTGGVKFLQTKTNAYVYINEKDLNLMENQSFIFGKKDFDNIILTSTDTKIDFDGSNIEVLETPGHSPGGICYKYGNKVFTGDTLFKNALGRTDFPHGNIEELFKSIKANLFTLPREYKIYPGHGDISTIGDEIKANSYLGI